MKHVSDIASAMTQIFESDEHKSLFGLPYKTAQTVQRHNQVDPSSNCDGAMARGECLKCHKTVDSNKADDCSVEETSDKDSNKFAKINVFYKLANNKDLDEYIKTEEEAGKRLHRDPRYQTILEKLLDEGKKIKQKYNDLLPSNKKPSSFKDIDYSPFEYEETNLEDFNFSDDIPSNIQSMSPGLGDYGIEGLQKQLNKIISELEDAKGEAELSEDMAKINEPLIKALSAVKRRLEDKIFERKMLENKTAAYNPKLQAPLIVRLRRQLAEAIKIGDEETIKELKERIKEVEKELDEKRNKGKK